MTSNTKAAESVQVAPYLTHVVSHHGRITLIPPENAGRTRKTSKLHGKREKKSSRRLGERSAKSEDNEEARFNLGTPRSARSVTSGTARRRRPRSADENRSRGREAGGYDEDIPDYPPPTFQEATSGSASSFTPNPTLPIQSEIVTDPASSNTAQLSPNPSPTTDQSPMVSQRPSLRLLSVIVEPSTSLPPSPAPLTSSLSSPSPSTSPQTFSYPHSSPISPLPPTPQSPGSDSDSDSQEYLCLSLDPSKRQWEEDRQLGLPFQERVQRERERLLARQVDGTPAGNDPQAQLHSSTQEGPSRCTFQEALGPDRAQPPSTRKGRPTLQVPHPDWRLTLDEPSLRSMTSAPSLATHFSQKARSPLSPLRPSWPAISRPYHSAGAASSTLSLSLGHLRLPGSFGKSTTFLGASSAQTGGRESTGSRRLFSKGKGKEKDKSLSDGDLDEVGEEEALDSWELIEQPAIGEPGPSTRVRPSRPRLTLKPPLKAFDISTSTYDEKAVAGKRGENDTRVDPFPISAEPASSPETERPSSISPTPTNFYPPPAPFSSSTLTPTLTTTSRPHPPARVLDQDLESRRQRCGSMRTRPAPPPPSEFLNKRVHRPAPPPPPVRTGFIRATPPYSPTSPSMPSSLSNIPAPVAPSHALQTSCTVPIPTPTPIQGTANRRRTPPPPPPIVPNITGAAESYDRALEIPLPPTPSDPSSVRPWIPILSVEKDREIQREVRRRYGYAPGPHLYSNASTHPQPPAPVPNDYSITARTGPVVDYTHVPTVPSRLAVSIPTDSQSPPLSSRSITSSPATPRGHHFPGRPLPMTPHVASPVATVGNGMPSSVGIIQGWSHRRQQHHDQIHNHTDVNVPEGLLIDFETDLDSNNRSGSTYGGDMDGTAAGDENGTDFPIPSPGSAADDERQSVFESTGSSDTSSAASPVVTAPAPPQFSEYTDLDVLLSRMEENQNGTNYDTLLLIQDFVGPAVAQNSNDVTSPRTPSALLGKIEIIRRRVLKDGRVKLKLSLLGAMVDKCGICLFQFKESELGALGVGCQHAFHEKCLRCWLARSRTCPLCRVPLDITGS